MEEDGRGKALKRAGDGVSPAETADSQITSEQGTQVPGSRPYRQTSGRFGVNLGGTAE